MKATTAHREATMARVKAGEAPPGAVVELADGSFGVVLAVHGMRSGVPVDLWHQPAALLSVDEEVELVEGSSGISRLVRSPSRSHSVA